MEALLFRAILVIRQYITNKKKEGVNRSTYGQQIVGFRNWLRSLKDVKARARIRVRINRIRLGNFGDCKPVGSGVSEFRIDYGPGYRVYFGRVGEKLVLLICGDPKGIRKKI